MADILEPTYDEIHEACINTAKAMKQYGFEFPRIVAVTRGGLLPGLILSHLLDAALTPVNYSSLKGEGEYKGYDNSLPSIREPRILLVDDICDSGNTLYELKTHYEQRGLSVYTFVLYYKSLPVPMIIPDFKWRTVRADSGWVTFPHEKK